MSPTVIGSRRRGTAGARSLLARLVLLTAISFSLATVIVSGVHFGRQVGLVNAGFLRSISVPGIILGSASAPNIAALQEAGVVEPTSSPIPNIAPIDSPPALPLGDPLTPLSPSPEIVSLPALHGGTWVPILMYHYIRVVKKSDLTGYNLSVTPTNFRAQMQYLSDNGYTTITMRQLDLALMGQGTLPPKPVALTFDDAYQDFYTDAAPTLQEFGMTATSYVPTMLVERPNYMTWAEIEELDAQGFEMAAHSQFHVDVSKATVSRATVEIFGAKSDLENHLGHDVVDWAYPYGGYNLNTVRLVHDAGYWSGTTTHNGAWHNASQLPLLTRVRVPGGELLAGFIASLGSR
ncbi:MAG TPA: polysaccharide deacetylase family protein [Candidatus Solibacter sp.]|jgi:peptidoglycan/xylan/chitin deacetylase (PgdA/CDA1 family)|nr:polysaccharide deacetylase family protein [Candidatus Solibacter sp.]